MNHYVEPVYTLDADILVISSRLPDLTAYLQREDFQVVKYAHSVNAQPPATDLRIQSTTGTRATRISSRATEDELDLIRLTEAHPHLIALYPEELRRLF